MTRRILKKVAESYIFAVESAVFLYFQLFFLSFVLFLTNLLPLTYTIYFYEKLFFMVLANDRLILPEAEHVHRAPWVTGYRLRVMGF